MATRDIKSFAIEKKDNSKNQPIKFKLGDEEFEAYAQVSGAVLLDFVANSDGEDPVETSKAILNYLKNSMDESNRKRFDKLIKDPEMLIPIDTLSEIVGFLIQERTSRPTEASSE